MSSTFAVVMNIAFTPDARGEPLAGELASVGYEKVVDVRPLASVAVLPPARAGLGGFLAAQTTAVITPESEARTPIDPR